MHERPNSNQEQTFHPDQLLLRCAWCPPHMPGDPSGLLKSNHLRPGQLLLGTAPQRLSQVTLSLSLWLLCQAWIMVQDLILHASTPRLEGECMHSSGCVGAFDIGAAWEMVHPCNIEKWSQTPGTCCRGDQHPLSPMNCLDFCISQGSIKQAETC